MMRATTMYYDVALPSVLTNVSFEVRRGEVFGLVGPSGSGKSTTLQILAGRLVQTYGKVKVLGRSPRRRAMKARIGYMPEPAGRSGNKHRAGIAGSLRKVLGWRRRRQVATRGPLPTEYRAAMAQALLKNPDVLMLDEPFIGFDPIGCSELKELLLTLSRRGKTVIISSDSLFHLKDLCDRIAVFYGGSVEAVGTIEELLARPNAVRFLAPVVSAPALEHLLQIIRQDLASGARGVGLQDYRLEKALAGPSPSGMPDPIADPINHKRLAELTQPSSAAVPRLVETTKSGDPLI